MKKVCLFLKKNQLQDANLKMKIVLYLCCFLSLVRDTRCTCNGNSNICHWSNWHAWGQCSSICGAGNRTRVRPACCRKHTPPLNFTECLKDCQLEYNGAIDQEACIGSGVCSTTRSSTITTTLTTMTEPTTSPSTTTRSSAIISELITDTEPSASTAVSAGHTDALEAGWTHSPIFVPLTFGLGAAFLIALFSLGLVCCIKSNRCKKRQRIQEAKWCQRSSQIRSDMRTKMII